MNLYDLYLSKSRAAVMLQLFGLNHSRVHMRSLQRASGLSIGAIQKEVDRLLKLDLILSERVGNRRYLQANIHHPLYVDLRNIVLKTSGLVDVLKSALGNDGIDFAFVFGSLARSEERSHSDIDLFVVGAIGLREVSKRLMDKTDILGREINPIVFPKKEFIERLKKKHHFISRVVTTKKLFIVGSEETLALTVQSAQNKT